ncbi:MAG: response regulator [Methylobacterium sp.]|uniref:response regulator n=1 Tax=Methylobacterium sp. TaxID=409 RepID=UPI002588A1CB|nr:response regulator [Methylobacterium sp.]MBY0299983.1 response regulator [Methylobacterium sp.]
MSGPTPDQTTILIVEDNYLLLEMLVALFEQEGLQTLTASSGEAALTLLRERGTAIGWLFTDIRLPGLIDGWMVAEAYRSLHPGRPVIYSTTSATADHRRMQGGIVLQKPFVLADVMQLALMMRGGSVADGLRCA